MKRVERYKGEAHLNILCVGGVPLGIFQAAAMSEANKEPRERLADKIRE